ncbi:MAG: HEAT repeat domain-containing protein, partial [Planctomycetaceae bacterium]|nr:HEAT repeat domain-containing protein [Planctomycetaceae bacterium]
MCFLIVLGTGCEAFLIQTPAPAWKTDRYDARFCETLSQDLEHDHWQPNPVWSPTREWENREPHGPAAGSLRWRYASKTWEDSLQRLDDNIALEEERPSVVWTTEDHLAQLAKQDTPAGWNAAILLAQRIPHGADGVEPILKKLVTQSGRLPASESPATEKASSNGISPNMRAAAAEAWCLVLASRAEEPIDALADAGTALLDFRLPDEVRAELFRGIGRWVPPANVPGLDQHVPETRNDRPIPITLRRAALDACVLYALWNRDAIPSDPDEKNTPWPATLLKRQWESDSHFERDPLVRERFAHWLVLINHPNAAKVLESHLIDQNPEVRDAALIHLGTLKTQEALKTLQTHAKRPEPRVRAMAVKGLAHWGVPYLVKSLDDDSHEVRLSVAEELGRYPTTESAVWLQKLQADPNRQVEIAAMEATRHWPDDLAIPVLLHGMEHASPDTRRECLRELRKRRNIEDSFHVTAGPEVRQLEIAKLARDLNLPRQLVASNPSTPLDSKTNHLRVAE